MPEALISLGSNVGQPSEQIARAVAHLSHRADVEVEAVSPLYRTVPVGPVVQDDFVNAAVRLKTNLSADELMTHLLTIEAIMGRDRAHAVRWGPRIIDLDLILYDDLHVQTDHVAVPHPRFRERAFVLIPLADIAPEWIVDGQTIGALAAAIDPQGVERFL